MKQHTHVTGNGGKDWYSNQLCELQSEVLDPVQSFFGKYGACIVSGCEMTPNANPALVDIAAGIIAIRHATDGFKLCRYAGDTAVDVAGDVYWECVKTTVTGPYNGGGATDDVAYTYTAELQTGIVPDSSDKYLQIATDGLDISQVHFEDVFNDANLTDWESISLVNVVGGSTLKARINKNAKLLYLQGIITINGFTGDGLNIQILAPSVNPTKWPDYRYAPAVRQFFTAYRLADPTAGTWITEVNNIDYLTQINGYADPDDLVLLPPTPASGSSYTVYINAVLQLD